MGNIGADQNKMKDKLQYKLEQLRGIDRRRPKYEMIKEFLQDEFENGEYEPGDALPSENTLIEKLGVARNTVRQAIDELVKEGLVKRLHGKGNYFIQAGNNGAGEQSALFGLILPEISRGQYPCLASGFNHGAGKGHRQMLLCNTYYDINRQGNMILQMIEKNVRGVALVPALSPPTPAFHILQLQRHEIPVVFCHRRVAGVSAPLITWDAAAVAHLAGKTLIDHGHRRIAYFARVRYSLTEIHETALRQTLRASGLDLPNHCVCYGDNPKDGNTNGHLQKRKDAIRPLLSGLDPVTAIFCNDDNEAELIYYALSELGIRVPDDVSLIGFGDSSSREGPFSSRLSSVSINEYDLGVRAVEILDEMRTGQRPIDSEEVVYKPISLTDGETVAAV